MQNIPNGFVYQPMVITRSGGNERAMDIYSRLLDGRIVFLFGAVTDEMSQALCAQLHFLSNDSEDPISLYINSPGGSVTSGLAMYDTMQFIRAPVHTYVMGQAASMGSFLAQAGEAGHRYVLPESRTMIHRVSSGSPGMSGSIHIQDLQFQDIVNGREESHRLNNRLTKLYEKHNSAGKQFEDLFETMKFDTFLSAKEAIDFGLADEIITKKL